MREGRRERRGVGLVEEMFWVKEQVLFHHFVPVSTSYFTIIDTDETRFFHCISKMKLQYISLSIKN